MSASMSGLSATEKVLALSTAPHVTPIMRGCIKELIAEHADLLAALIDCVAAIRQECDGDEDHHAHPMIAAHMKTAERARAIIAKARGES